MYNCCGQPDNNIPYDKVKASTVQKIFCDQLLHEIKWIKGKERVDKQSKDISQINIKSLSSGQDWINETITSLRIKNNIIKDWITGVYQWCNLVPDANIAANVKDIVENWTRIDPGLLGEVSDKAIINQLDHNFV